MIDWQLIKELPVAVTVCDARGIILEMNDRSVKVYEKDGGRKLIGSSVLDCHPEKARAKLGGMLESGSGNCYTTEKNGKRKLIYQTPWYSDGKYMGLVEFIMEIPTDLPLYKRAGPGTAGLEVRLALDRLE